MNDTSTFKEPHFVKGETVFNYRTNRPGVIHNTARYGMEKVRVMMQGNLTAFYYHKTDFYPDWKERVEEIRAERKVNPPPPEPPRKGRNPNVDIKTMESDPEWAAKLGSPIKHPEHTHSKGEHMKSYVINYVTKDGQFHVDKIAAKGIVTAITIFYFNHAEQERAIVSVICVL